MKIALTLLLFIAFFIPVFAETNLGYLETNYMNMQPRFDDIQDKDNEYLSNSANPHDRRVYLRKKRGLPAKSTVHDDSVFSDTKKEEFGSTEEYRAFRSYRDYENGTDGEDYTTQVSSNKGSTENINWTNIEGDDGYYQVVDKKEDSFDDKYERYQRRKENIQGVGVDLGITSREYSSLKMPSVFVPEAAVKYYYFEDKTRTEARLYMGVSDKFDFDNTWIIGNGSSIADSTKIAWFSDANLSYYGIDLKCFLDNKFVTDCFWFAVGYDVNNVLNSDVDSGFMVKVLKADLGYSFNLSENLFFEPKVSFYKATTDTLVLDGDNINLGSNLDDNGLSFGFLLASNF